MAEVSHAFQILSDADKRAQYDRTGVDPESKGHPGGASAGSAFSGGRPGPQFASEISPEELFARFFNGGFGGMGGSPFDNAFGMTRPARHGINFITNPMAQVALSLYLIWEEADQASVCISSEEASRAADLVQLAPSRRRHLMAGLLFANYYLFSSFSSFRSSPLSSLVLQPQPVRHTESTVLHPRTSWAAQHPSLILITT